MGNSISPAVRREIEKILERKNPGGAIVVGSPGVLDEKTWNAVDAFAPAVEGHLLPPYVRDVTDDVWYTALPASIPVGHTVYGDVFYYNDGDYKEIFTCTVELIDPDGRSRGKFTGSSYVPPGEQRGEHTEDVVLDKAGIWKIHAILED